MAIIQPKGKRVSFMRFGMVLSEWNQDGIFLMLGNYLKTHFRVPVYHNQVFLLANDNLKKNQLVDRRIIERDKKHA